MIYTSNFSALGLHKLPKGARAISIAGRAPNWYTGEQYKILAPKYWFYKKYKEDGDSDYYTLMYNAEVLVGLNASEVIQILCNLVGYGWHYRNIHRDKDRHIVLLCYEKPDDFCHRHLVAEWLNKSGFECKEYLVEARCDG